MEVKKSMKFKIAVYKTQGSLERQHSFKMEQTEHDQIVTYLTIKKYMAGMSDSTKRKIRMASIWLDPFWHQISQALCQIKVIGMYYLLLTAIWEEFINNSTI